MVLFFCYVQSLSRGRGQRPEVKRALRLWCSRSCYSGCAPALVSLNTCQQCRLSAEPTSSRSSGARLWLWASEALGTAESVSTYIPSWPQFLCSFTHKEIRMMQTFFVLSASSVSFWVSDCQHCLLHPSDQTLSGVV
jgi:hypothetical protein